MITMTESTDNGWSRFAVPQEICKALSEEGFTEPTQIQSLTLPPAILGLKDIIGAAETGSGKTLAFGLPILTGILNLKNTSGNGDVESSSEESGDEGPEINDIEIDENGGIKMTNNKAKKRRVQRPLYALILTPTRELAIQVKNHLVAAAKYTGINVAVVVGGMSAEKQERILNKGPEIVVATPGRLWQLIQLGNTHLEQIDSIRYLAIDETDRMLERKHFEELNYLLEKINSNENNRNQRQNFVFSATLTLVHDLPKYLYTKFKRVSKKINNMKPELKLRQICDTLGIVDPKIVDITRGVGTSGTLTECKITCSLIEKDYYVYYFLQKHRGRTLIFCNSIGCVKRLSNLLGLLNCNPLPLHASMAQRQRLKNLDRFRDNEFGVLVATDVAARGLDIPCVEHVLHYQTPRTSESYVHRSGRTARIYREGITVLLIDPSEVKSYISLCRNLGKEKDIASFPIQRDFLKAVKDRVNLARDLDKLELRVKKGNSEVGWLKKAAEEMDIIVDDVHQKYDSEETRTSKKLGDIKRKQLMKLLDKPIFPSTFRGKYLLHSDEINLPFEQVNQKAVDVAQNSIEISKSRPLFKPKKKVNKPKRNQ